MSSKISVIIPVYNVETYVECCIRSLFNQTFIDFEAIAVDDGSTDQSGIILDCLQKEDSRLKVFHQPNGGVSKARNFAMKQAEGDFLCFLDSDDSYQPEMLEALLYAQKQTQADLVVTAYSYYFEETQRIETIDCHFEGVCDKNKALWLMFQPHGYRCYLFTKLFKKNLVKSSDAILSFHNELRMMEDMVFVVEYMARCQSVAFVNKSFYKYLMRANSAIHTLSIEEKIKSIETVLPFVRENFDTACSDSLRWTYYTSLIGQGTKKEARYISETIRKISKERRYFFFANKYSYWGYLKHLVEEFLLRIRYVVSKSFTA